MPRPVWLESYDRRRPLRIAAMFVVAVCMIIAAADAWRSQPSEDRTEECRVERIAERLLLCEGQPEVRTLDTSVLSLLMEPGERAVLSCRWYPGPDGLRRGSCKVVEVHAKPK